MLTPIALLLVAAAGPPAEPFPTLVNPACSHCRDEAKRRAGELRPDDRVLCWTRGYSDGGAIPFRFFLNAYRVISDSYGVFVHDPDAGFARGFAPSYEFRFDGWRNGVMVMKHKDGTRFSCLTGMAFDGPRKGAKLQSVPTLVSDWGVWLDRYPDAVAYHMFEKYRAVELPAKPNDESVKSRPAPDRRLPANEEVLGVAMGKSSRAYPIKRLIDAGMITDTVEGEPLVVLWEPLSMSASAYRPIASQPRKFQAPRPNKEGVSPPDDGKPLTAVVGPRKVSLKPAEKGSAGRFTDAETKSFWDVAGRCVAGELKGWTLEWADSLQVRWFAWAAEHPSTTVFVPEKAEANKKVREVAGSAEFLRLLPKPFATLKAVDVKNHTVTLLLDGDKLAKVWPVEPDAEVKVGGWWGRLEQFKPGDRVWAWLKLDRKKNPTSVVMLADEVSEYDLHGSLKEAKGQKAKFAPEQVEEKRAAQKAWLRERWARDGLPGTLTFHHVFSGELELTLDHEAMRWGRSLALGDVVHLAVDTPIKGVVKVVTPWRERTVVRLVVGELESSELKIGTRVGLRMTPLTEAVESSVYPPDLGRPRTKAERVEWFLASIYCTCGVNRDVCTGHFYTLASCNPNGCALPRKMRQELAERIDAGKSDREIFDEIVKEQGRLTLKPHLLP